MIWICIGLWSHRYAEINNSEYISLRQIHDQPMDEANHLGVPDFQTNWKI